MFQTPAIILNKYPQGEFNFAYKALTQKYGLVYLLAKSARKSKAKLPPHLEPGSVTDLLFVPRLKTTSALLTGSKTQWKPDFHKLPLYKSRLILQALNFTQRLAPEEEDLAPQKIAALYQLLEFYLKKITKTHSPQKTNLYQIGFLLKLLGEAGFSPNLKHCLICGQKISKNPKIYYNTENGGLVCCKKAPSQIEIKSLNSLKLITFLEKEPLEKITKIKINPAAIREASRLVMAHLNYCL